MNSHSPVDGLFSCFQLGAIKKNTAVNIKCESFCRHMLSFFLVKYLGMKLLGHMVSL